MVLAMKLRHLIMIFLYLMPSHTIVRVNHLNTYINSVEYTDLYLRFECFFYFGFIIL